jgi:hypothetical protein
VYRIAGRPVPVGRSADELSIAPQAVAAADATVSDS